MPLLTVTGGALPPSGKTLSGAQFRAYYLTPYADGVNVYPQTYDAVLTGGAWQDLSGQPMRLPGGAVGLPYPGQCIITETQSYSDGSSQSFQRGPFVIFETAPDEWAYGSPPPGSLYAALKDAPPPSALLASQLGKPDGVAALDGAGVPIGALAASLLGQANGAAQLNADGLLALTTVAGLGDALTGKAPAEHNHDGAYYTKSDVNTIVSGYVSVDDRGTPFGVATLDSAGRLAQPALYRGTNSNGTYYVQNGLDSPQICTGKVRLEYANANSLTGRWDFPKGFGTSDYTVFLTPRNSLNSNAMGYIRVTNASGSFATFQAYPSGDASFTSSFFVDLFVSAIGFYSF